MPIRHGMTLGELAKLFNAENKIGADLTVVPLKNWRRDQWFDSTGLPWINPSPNMRNLLQATVYPGVGAIEGTNLSVGRGTDTPFEQLGAPWIDGVKLAEALNARTIPGISFYPVRFTPTSSKYANEECQGVFLVVTDRLALRPVRLGAEIASAISRLHGTQFQLEAAERLFGSKEGLARIRAGDDPATLVSSWSAAEARWRLLRAKYSALPVESSHALKADTAPAWRPRHQNSRRMALTVGTRLGSYEILSALGAGGMGEVYRARDPKLNRDVAIKVLPACRRERPRTPRTIPARSAGPRVAEPSEHRAHSWPGRLAGTLRDRDGAGRGPTLADRIAQGPMSLDDVLPIAQQIAEALEAAHEQGIVHRDLKPANIKVRPDGTVKVLDFGLAKALDPPAGTEAAAALANSPTLTSPAMTQRGVILGTSAYMSPEQAKGYAADKRSDVWAFGCVLYEMLTGRRAFEGDDVSETLATVIKGEPDWNALQPNLPQAIKTLIRGCLRKSPKQRIGDISTARFVLSEPDALMQPAVASQARTYRWRGVMLVTGGVLIGAILAAAAVVEVQAVPDGSGNAIRREPASGTTVEPESQSDSPLAGRQSSCLFGEWPALSPVNV